MSDLEDRLADGRDAVAKLKPPADLWERVVERSSPDGVTLHPLPVSPVRRPEPPVWLAVVSIAACLVAVIAVVAVVMPDRQAVDTIDPADAPSATIECPDDVLPRSTTEGAQMKTLIAVPAATAVTALVLLGGCSDDDSTNLAQGDDIELVGDENLAGQTLDISAEEADGEVTGELRFTDTGGEVVVEVECADTDTDDVVILGGTVTESTDDQITGLAALYIVDGEPDRVAVWLDDGDNETCEDLLQNRRDVLDDDSQFFEVADGSDIEIG
jgi:hypothetical protein